MELNNSSSMNIPSATNTEESTTFQFHSSSGNNNGKIGNNYFKCKTHGYGGAKGHNRVCIHYGRTNHTIETCFLKHGYPSGFKGKHKTTNSVS